MNKFIKKILESKWFKQLLKKLPEYIKQHIQRNSMQNELNEPFYPIMTINGVNVTFDYTYNDTHPLTVGAMVEFIYWPTPTLPVRLGGTTAEEGQDGTILPNTIIGGDNVVPSLRGYIPPIGTVISTQISFDYGETWLQVYPIDSNENSIDLAWHPNTTFTIYGFRRPV